ncbi:MAG: type II secretion system protein N [Sphingomonas sp.]|jgi:general secretion pathway protein N|nr:MAG: type II secretion system protein N [Sphingomonas sp.]
MRRIRLRTAPTALFGAMLLVALVVFLPMRAVLGWAGVGEQGFVARSVSGTIWGATLRDARFGDLALGDLHARLSPWPLFVGRAKIVMEGPESATRTLRGAASISRHAVGVDDLSANIATGGVFAPVPVSALDLDAVSVRFRDGQCESAEGRVRATLAGDVGGIVLPQSVAGNARCEGASLLLPLTSQAGTEGIALRIDAGGRYRAELSLRPSDPLAAQKLEAAGFVANGSGYRLSIEGHF